jgi:hypothetical protein
MIIAQSSLQLSQASNQYQRLSMEATTQQTSSNSAANALRPLELTSQHSFQAQQSIQSKLHSNSRISYADQRVEQHAMVKTSAQLTHTLNRLKSLLNRRFQVKPVVKLKPAV